MYFITFIWKEYYTKTSTTPKHVLMHATELLINILSSVVLLFFWLICSAVLLPVKLALLDSSDFLATDVLCISV